MANTKKTKRLLIKEINVLGPEVAKQQKIVDDLDIKRVHAQQHYDDAAAKLAEMQGTLDDYKKDKDKK